MLEDLRAIIGVDIREKMDAAVGLLEGCQSGGDRFGGVLCAFGVPCEEACGVTLT